MSQASLGEARRPGLGRYKPYPEYKDSGVEWLGEIPAHWKVHRLRRVASIASGAAPPPSFDRLTGRFPVFGSNGLIGFCDDYMLHRSAIVVGRVGASGVVNEVPAQSWVTDNALLVSNLASDMEARWLHCSLRAMDIGAYAMRTAQPLINATQLGDLSMGLPPVREQRAVLAFLDRETARIDELIAKKERLIELLHEKRTALITRAVTKGLDPTVPMKDSGVEWLGEVPTHWQLTRLGAAVVGCKNGVWGGEPNGVDDVYCVRVADFDRTTLRVDPAELTLRSVDRRQHVRNALEPGDLLIEKSGGGERQPVGTVVLFDIQHEAVCSNFIARMRPASGFRGDYFVYLHAMLYSARVTTRSIKQNTGIQNLDSDSYLDEIVAVPEVAEQEEVVAFLDRETAEIDSLVKRVRSAIDRLKELRTALISAAVTGKIDVRDEVS